VGLACENVPVVERLQAVAPRRATRVGLAKKPTQRFNEPGYRASFAGKVRIVDSEVARTRFMDVDG